MNNWRKTSQFLMSAKKERKAKGKYDIYPSQWLEPGKIFLGFDGLAEDFFKQDTIILDGFKGVFFEDLKDQLQKQFDQSGKTVNWVDV